MKQKVWFICFVTMCLTSFFPEALPAAGRADVTMHEASFLENAVNFHIEWQSPNPVTLVKISIPGVEREIAVDPYDNLRNRDGYAGGIDVTLKLGEVPKQTFIYIIQLQDELRIKSLPVTGKVEISSSRRHDEAAQPKKPSMEINIQQNVTQTKSDGQLVGSVIITMGPEDVVRAGAKWRVDNGPWKKSGETISNLSVGTHTVDYSEVSNWTRPEKHHVLVEQGKTVRGSGKYRSP